MLTILLPNMKRFHSRAASTKMAAKSVEQNIQSVVEHVIPRVPRKAANIASISIKTDTSATLPIYNKVREELNDIRNLAKIESKKGKKRTLDSDEGVEVEEEDKLQQEEKKKKQKKGEASLKSPLLKALKKKKKQEIEEQDEEKETKTKSKQKKVDESKGDQKKKKVKENKVASEAKEEKKKVKENKVASKAKEEKSSLKKKKKITDDAASSKEDKSEFIASKKFKGSKKGYVFKKGAKGVGYYIDIKPIPDKMAMQALLRSSKGSSGSGGSRRKSMGNSSKKQGRRKGR